MDENSILGLKKDVFLGIPGESGAQIGTNNFEFAIGSLAKDLSVCQLRVHSCVPSHEDRVAQMDGAVGNVISRITHFPSHGHDRWIFEVVAAENTDGVKRLKNNILVFASQCIIEIKGQNFRSVV